jgi:hypothetical protein
MAPITTDQLLMMSDFLRVIECEPLKGFMVRDLVMHRRLKGRIIANDLPGIGRPCRWLDRETDDDIGGGTYNG